MNYLTEGDKLKIILEQCRKHNITAYEIGENTDVSNVAAHNILTGATSKPRHKTLNAILFYIENKITASAIKKEYKTEKPTGLNMVAEETVKNYSNAILGAIQELNSIMRRDHDAIAEGVKYTFDNSQLLVAENKKIIKYLKDNSKTIDSLITSIKGSRG